MQVYLPFQWQVWRWTEMEPCKGKEKGRTGLNLCPQVAEGENVFGLCHIFASFNDTCVHHRSFRQGNYLPCNWWDEGEGWSKWVLSICFHVGCPGCSPEMQRLGITLLSTSNSGTQEEIGPRLLDQGPVSTQSPCSLRDEDWVECESHSHPLWQHPQEGGRCDHHLWIEFLKLLLSVNKLLWCKKKKMQMLNTKKKNKNKN